MTIRALVICGTLLSCASLCADAKRTFSMSESKVKADLAAHGLDLNLPAVASGAVDWVFDSRFLVVRGDGVDVWVGRTDGAKQTPCTLDQLIAKAKDETGFVTITRRGNDGKTPLVAYSVRDKGRETFQVIGCMNPTRAICGAPDLTSSKAVDVAFARCGSLRDVAVDAHAAEANLGLYVTTFLDDNKLDRAAGRGGSREQVRATIDLRKLNEAVYAVGLTGKPVAADARLSDVVITVDTFTAYPIATKAPWPLYLPQRFDGRFAEPGILLLDSKRYERVKAETAQPKK